MKKRMGFLTRAVCSLLTLTVFTSSAFTSPVYASIYNLPAANEILPVSMPFSQPVLKGLKFDPSDPLKIDFIVDNADAPALTREEMSRLVDYFLAGLTIPEKDLWVNLSPYEQNRIVPHGLIKTNVGKDMLAQDYVLKQLASSLTYPESELGKQYWQMVNGGKVGEKPSFNKVWIVPGDVEIYEKDGTVFIAKAQLKAMMQEDVNALQANGRSVSGDTPSSRAMRELLLPAITKEVNEGKNFARLRQLYSALILSAYFKYKMANAVYSPYINQQKTQVIDIKDPGAAQNIHSLYVQAFKDGVYNYNRREKVSPVKVQVRQYYAGGEFLAPVADFNQPGGPVVHAGEMLSSEKQASTFKGDRSDTGTRLEPVGPDGKVSGRLGKALIGLLLLGAVDTHQRAALAGNNGYNLTNRPHNTEFTVELEADDEPSAPRAQRQVRPNVPVANIPVDPFEAEVNKLAIDLSNRQSGAVRGEAMKRLVQMTKSARARRLIADTILNDTDWYVVKIALEGLLLNKIDDIEVSYNNDWTKDDVEQLFGPLFVERGPMDPAGSPYRLAHDWKLKLLPQDSNAIGNNEFMQRKRQSQYANTIKDRVAMLLSRYNDDSRIRGWIIALERPVSLFLVNWSRSFENSNRMRGPRLSDEEIRTYLLSQISDSRFKKGTTDESGQAVWRSYWAQSNLIMLNMQSSVTRRFIIDTFKYTKVVRPAQLDNSALDKAENGDSYINGQGVPSAAIKAVQDKSGYYSNLQKILLAMYKYPDEMKYWSKEEIFEAFGNFADWPTPEGGAKSAAIMALSTRADIPEVQALIDSYYDKLKQSKSTEKVDIILMNGAYAYIGEAKAAAISDEELWGMLTAGKDYMVDEAYIRAAKRLYAKDKNAFVERVMRERLEGPQNFAFLEDANLVLYNLAMQTKDMQDVVTKFFAMNVPAEDKLKMLVHFLQGYSQDAAKYPAEQGNDYYIRASNAISFMINLTQAPGVDPKIALDALYVYYNQTSYQGGVGPKLSAAAVTAFDKICVNTGKNATWERAQRNDLLRYGTLVAFLAALGIGSRLVYKYARAKKTADDKIVPVPTTSSPKDERAAVEDALIERIEESSSPVHDMPMVPERSGTRHGKPSDGSNEGGSGHNVASEGYTRGHDQVVDTIRKTLLEIASRNGMTQEQRDKLEASGDDVPWEYLVRGNNIIDHGEVKIVILDIKDLGYENQQAHAGVSRNVVYITRAAYNESLEAQRGVIGKRNHLGHELKELELLRAKAAEKGVAYNAIRSALSEEEMLAIHAQAEEEVPVGGLKLDTIASQFQGRPLPAAEINAELKGFVGFTFSLGPISTVQIKKTKRLQLSSL